MFFTNSSVMNNPGVLIVTEPTAQGLLHLTNTVHASIRHDPVRTPPHIVTFTNEWLT